VWLTLAVVTVCAILLWREARAVRQGFSSRRQFIVRLIGCALLLALALVLQFKESILLPAGAASSGARLLRLLQFSIGVFVLVMALVLVALLDARETLQRYLRERRQIVDDLIQAPHPSPSTSGDSKHDGNTL
jgi:hypothetical protein